MAEQKREHNSGLRYQQFVKGGREVIMNNLAEAKRLPIDVREVLKAICTTGKGRCWHCDAKLPKAQRAIREGWDVQRLDDYPVASIILVCPACLRQQAPADSNCTINRGAVDPVVDQRSLHTRPILAPGET
jgi:hypothetical protein